MANVDVIYVSQDQHTLQTSVTYATGMTVQQALDASGFLETYPHLKGLAVGIFSRQVSLETVLKPGDRLEIYRPLIIDPMEKRRQRAKG